MQKNKMCDICGSRFAECEHHLIFGRGLREKANEDSLVLDLCNSCHNMNPIITERIHDNSMAEKLSKMLGQALWELNQVSSDQMNADLKEAFRQRYGRSYL